MVFIEVKKVMLDVIGDFEVMVDGCIGCDEDYAT
jgi:hypothetical protein